MENVVEHMVPLETTMISLADFWNGKKVFLTGHTGFKGSWLSIWLHMLGAKVYGYALQPPTEPSLFQLAANKCLFRSVIGDIRNADCLCQALLEAEPDIVLHLAAQPLVRESYKSPVDTFETNVIGTVNLLEAVRKCSSVRAVLNVTTDKCYENTETSAPFKESDHLGGADPYSCSKACSEIVTAAWRSSFFPPVSHATHQLGVATARAGNVIGGGDWATDRLLPDVFRALLVGEPVRIRNPHAVRPWQHVLEPLLGYLTLARLLFEQQTDYGEAWNFGPEAGDALPVIDIVQKVCDRWGRGASCLIEGSVDNPHEAGILRLAISKAQSRLNWNPRWNIEAALDATVQWTLDYVAGKDMLEITEKQIRLYSAGEMPAKPPSGGFA